MAPYDLVGGYQRFEKDDAVRFRVKEGGSMFLKTVGTHAPDYTAS
jgi:hypothetical protein